MPLDPLKHPYDMALCTDELPPFGVPVLTESEHGTFASGAYTKDGWKFADGSPMDTPRAWRHQWVLTDRPAADESEPKPCDP